MESLNNYERNKETNKQTKEGKELTPVKYGEGCAAVDVRTHMVTQTSPPFQGKNSSQSPNTLCNV
jgi:hypothetical protein